jgi:hypothetical protein
MADFCKKCSIKNFGEDYGDLEGLITETETKQGFVSSPVICEGCGVIQVNHLGECISKDCEECRGI